MRRRRRWRDRQRERQPRQRLPRRCVAERLRLCLPRRHRLLCGRRACHLLRRGHARRRRASLRRLERGRERRLRRCRSLRRLRTRQNAPLAAARREAGASSAARAAFARPRALSSAQCAPPPPIHLNESPDEPGSARGEGHGGRPCAGGRRARAAQRPTRAARLRARPSRALRATSAARRDPVPRTQLRHGRSAPTPGAPARESPRRAPLAAPRGA